MPTVKGGKGVLPHHQHQRGVRKVRLVQLTLDEGHAQKVLDMLLAKKRAADRRAWLEAKGDLADVVV